MNMFRLKLLATAALMLVPSTQAFAQDSSATARSDNQSIETIVVTAQKRAENVQDVPLSIVAFSGGTLVANNVTDVKGLEKIVPSLRLDAIAQSAGFAIRIRGFGTSSNAAIDPSVAPYVDGVYIARPGSLVSSFLDVAGVEVLRGPQGTLFGRNATVGALSIRSTAPSTSGQSGSIIAEAGSYGTSKVEGIFNQPLSQTFAARVAAYHAQTDGFITNRSDGQKYGSRNDDVARLSVKGELTPAIGWTGRVDYARSTGDGFAGNQLDTNTMTPSQIAGLTAKTLNNPPILNRETSLTVNQKFDNPDLNDRQYGVSSELNFDTQSGFSIKMINAYRDWQNEQTDGDVVFTPLDLLNRHAKFQSTSTSHELQLISPKDKLLGGRFDFVAGLYYFDEDYSIVQSADLGTQLCGILYSTAATAARKTSCLAGPALNAYGTAFNQAAKSTAAYLQTDFKITPKIDLILGARTTQDKKSGSFVGYANNSAVGAGVIQAPETTNLNFKDSRPNWRANLTWHIAPETMAFVTYSTGYKSGGFNSAGAAASLGAKRLFQSETSDDVEIGLKTMGFDRRVQINVTLFQTNLKGFQERSFDGLSFIIRNAGDVRAKGVEVEGQARVIDHLKVDFGIAYNDSIYTSNKTAPGLPGCTGAATSCPTIQNLTGKATTNSPKWQNNFGVEYNFGQVFAGWSLKARTGASYASDYLATPDLNPQSKVNSLTLYNGRITVTSPKADWVVALAADNLSDKRFLRGRFAQTFDSQLGLRDTVTGASALRGFIGAPRTVTLRVAKTF